MAKAQTKKQKKKTKQKVFLRCVLQAIALIKITQKYK